MLLSGDPLGAAQQLGLTEGLQAFANWVEELDDVDEFSQLIPVIEAHLGDVYDLGDLVEGAFVDALVGEDLSTTENFRAELEDALQALGASNTVTDASTASEVRFDVDLADLSAIAAKSFALDLGIDAEDLNVHLDATVDVEATVDFQFTFGLDLTATSPSDSFFIEPSSLRAGAKVDADLAGSSLDVGFLSASVDSGGGLDITAELELELPGLTDGRTTLTELETSSLTPQSVEVSANADFDLQLPIDAQINGIPVGAGATLVVGGVGGSNVFGGELSVDVEDVDLQSFLNVEPGDIVGMLSDLGNQTQVLTSILDLANQIPFVGDSLSSVIDFVGELQQVTDTLFDAGIQGTEIVVGGTFMETTVPSGSVPSFNVVVNPNALDPADTVTYNVEVPEGNYTPTSLVAQLNSELAGSMVEARLVDGQLELIALDDSVQEFLLTGFPSPTGLNSDLEDFLGLGDDFVSSLVYQFDTIQELETLLAPLSGVSYDAASRSLLFDFTLNLPAINESIALGFNETVDLLIADLELAGSVQADVTAGGALTLKAGIDLSPLETTTEIDALNGGRGVGTNASGAADLAIQTRDGGSFTVDLSSLTATSTIQDVADLIEAAGPVSVRTEGGHLEITDDTAGSETFAIGIGWITPQTPLAALNGGAGIDTNEVGDADFTVHLRSGAEVAVDLSAIAATADLQDVLDAINAAGAGQLTASVATGSLVLTDLTAGSDAFRVLRGSSSGAVFDLGLSSQAFVKAGAVSIADGDDGAADGVIRGGTVFTPSSASLDLGFGILTADEDATGVIDGADLLERFFLDPDDSQLGASVSLSSSDFSLVGGVGFLEFGVENGSLSNFSVDADLSLEDPDDSGRLYLSELTDRTFGITLGTPLDELFEDFTVGIATGADLTIELRDGTSFDVDFSGLTGTSTIDDVIRRIENASKVGSAARVDVSVSVEGDALQIVDLTQDIGVGTLTIDADVTDGETVKIGDDVYEFDLDGTVAAGNIQVDVSGTGMTTPLAAVARLRDAINTSGTESVFATTSMAELLVQLDDPSLATPVLSESLASGSWARSGLAVLPVAGSMGSELFGFGTTGATDGDDDGLLEGGSLRGFSFSVALDPNLSFSGGDFAFDLVLANAETLGIDEDVSIHVTGSIDQLPDGSLAPDFQATGNFQELLTSFQNVSPAQLLQLALEVIESIDERFDLLNQDLPFLDASINDLLARDADPGDPDSGLVGLVSSGLDAFFDGELANNLKNLQGGLLELLGDFGDGGATLPDPDSLLGTLLAAGDALEELADVDGENLRDELFNAVNAVGQAVSSLPAELDLLSAANPTRLLTAFMALGTVVADIRGALPGLSASAQASVQELLEGDGTTMGVESFVDQARDLLPSSDTMVALLMEALGLELPTLDTSGLTGISTVQSVIGDVEGVLTDVDGVVGTVASTLDTWVSGLTSSQQSAVMSAVSTAKMAAARIQTDIGDTEDLLQRVDDFLEDAKDELDVFELIRGYNLAQDAIELGTRIAGDVQEAFDAVEDAIGAVSASAVTGAVQSLRMMLEDSAGEIVDDGLTRLQQEVAGGLLEGYFPTGLVSFDYDDGDLLFHLQYDIDALDLLGVPDQFGVEFDLGSAIPLNFAGLVVDFSGEAGLGGFVDLGFGLEVLDAAGNLQAPRFFLQDTSEIALTADVDLSGYAEASILGVTASLGSEANRDATITLTDTADDPMNPGQTIAGDGPAKLGLSLDDGDGEADKIYLGNLASYIGSLPNLGFAPDAFLEANLPIYVNGNLVTWDADGDPMTAEEAVSVGAELEVTSFNSSGFNFMLDGLEQGEQDAILDNLTAFNLTNILAGIDAFLQALELGLGSDFIGSLPLIGDGASEAADAVMDFRVGFFDPFAESLKEIEEGLDATSTSMTVTTLLQGALDDALGGLNTFLGSAGQVTGTVVATFTGDPFGGNVKDAGVTLFLDLDYEKTITESFDFDLGLDGLALGFSGEPQFDITIAAGFEVTIGLNTTDGAFIEFQNGDDLTVELDVDVTTPQPIELELFFLTLTADVVNDPSKGLEGAGFGADFGLNFGDGKITNFGALTATPSFEVRVDADLELKSELGGSNGQLPSLSVLLDVDWMFNPDSNASPGLPQVSFQDLTLDVGEFLTGNLASLLGDVQDFIAPLEPVLAVLDTEIPVVSDLSKLIGQGPVTFGSAIQLLGKGFDTVQTFAKALDTAIDVIDFINDLDLSGPSLEINLGDLDFAQLGVDLSDPASRSMLSSGGMDLSGGFSLSGNPLSQLGGQGSSGQSAQKLISDSTKKVGFDTTNGLGLSFPIFQDPSALFGLLLGQRADLVFWDVPRLAAEFSFNAKFGPIIPPVPLFASIGGAVEVFADLAVGFDTRGLETGLGDFANGFYFADKIDGVDVPELGLTARLTAGAELNVVIASAGVRGGVEAGIFANWNDPDDDGKVYLDELLLNFNRGFECIFDFEGAISAFFEAYVKIGFDTFFGFITLFEKDFRLVDVTLLDFNHSCPPLPPADPANVIPFVSGLSQIQPGASNGTPVEVLLNIGPDAPKLRPGNTDGEERVFIIAERDLDGDGQALTGLQDLNGNGVIEEAELLLAEDFNGNGIVESDVIFVLTVGELSDADDNDANGKQPFENVAKISGDAGNFDDEIIVDPSVVALLELRGGAGNDLIQGAGGNDILRGGTGNDTLLGGLGRDQLLGEDGDDLLRGMLGNDTLNGNQGNDTLHGNDGDNLDPAELTPGFEDDDSLVGGDGSDELRGDAGRDVLVGGRGPDQLLGGFGNDNLSGGLEIDLIEGGAGSDLIDGGAGNDLLFGEGSDVRLASQVGNDTIHGGTGNDTIKDLFESEESELTIVEGGDDWFYGDEGDDEIVTDPLANPVGAAGRDRAFGGSGNDTITTGVGEDYIEGGEGSDTIFAGDDADRIVGGDVAALALAGGDGADLIFAGAGNDLVLGDNGGFYVSGSATSEDPLAALVRVQSSTSGGFGADTIHGELGDDTLFGGGLGDMLLGDLFGGAGADVLIGDQGYLTPGELRAQSSTVSGSGGVDLIYGRGGNDVLVGGDYGDSLFGSDGDDIVVGDNAKLTLLDTGTIPVGGGVTTQRIESADTASGGNDRVMGDLGADVVLAGVGDDFVSGGGVNDAPTASSPGSDILLGDNGVVVLADGSGEANDVFSSAPDDSGRDTITGSARADVILGGGQADVLDGLSGADVILGDHGYLQRNASNQAERIATTFTDVGGNDVVVAGNDADTVLGGFGQDLIDGGNDVADDVLLGDNGELVYGPPAVVALVRTTDTVATTGGSDTITGYAGDDTILGGVAGDSLYGNAGDDVILGDNGRVEQPGGVPAAIRTTELGLGGDDRIEGGMNADTVFGGFAADTIDGGLDDAADVLVGDNGEVLLGLDAGSQLVVELVRTTDSTNATGGSDVITGHGGDDTLLGGLAGDQLFGDAGSDVILGDNGLIDQPEGVLRLITTQDPTLGGADTIDAGDDPDTVFGGTAGDTIDGKGGRDLLFGDHGKIDFTIPEAEKNFFAIDTQAADLGGNDVIHGNGDDDTLLGQQGDDQLFGDQDDDDIIGGHNVAGGIDELDPGDLRNDTIDGGAGQDLVAGDNAIVIRRSDTLDPRFRTLSGATLFAADGSAAVNGAAQADPSGAPGRDVTLLDHSRVPLPDTFGNDSIVGGAQEDVLFGQLGDDVIQGDGSVALDVLATLTSVDGVGDADDYVEGGGGADLIFGNLGQDDLIGGSSDLYGLDTRNARPDGGDTILGASRSQIARNDAGDVTAEGHAQDADFILGDNGTVYRPVDASTGAFLAFAYDDYSGTEHVVPRVYDELDHVLGGTLNNLGGGDLVHGDGGDDTVLGQVGRDTLFGEGQDDDLIGGEGRDWISGGTGEDGILGDDGLVATSRNGVAEPLYGIVASTEIVASTPGKKYESVLYATGELSKSVDLEPYDLGGDDTLYGGLGDDSLHGGAGVDGLLGGEALDAFYGDPGATPRLRYDVLADDFEDFDDNDPLTKISGFLLNFDKGTSAAPIDDGDDVLFGDDGNDWLVGGTGEDHLFGGLGNDIHNLDDDLEQVNANTGTFDIPDSAFGGGGRDTLFGNTRDDRMVDWVGEYNAYIVPFPQNGAPTISRGVAPFLETFFSSVAAADGSDQTRVGPGLGTAERNGEPFGELGLFIQQDPGFGDQTGPPDDPQPGNKGGGSNLGQTSNGATGGSGAGAAPASAFGDLVPASEVVELAGTEAALDFEALESPATSAAGPVAASATPELQLDTLPVTSEDATERFVVVDLAREAIEVSQAEAVEPPTLQEAPDFALLELSEIQPLRGSPAAEIEPVSATDEGPLGAPVEDFVVLEAVDVAASGDDAHWGLLRGELVRRTGGVFELDPFARQGLA